MPIINRNQTITLTASGGTQNLSVYDPVDVYFIESSSAVSLSTSWVFQESGTAVSGTTYRFNYNADIILNGFQLEFFGTNMPQNLTRQKCQIVATFNGTAWSVDFISSAGTKNHEALIAFGKIAAINAGANANLLCADAVDSVNIGYVMPSDGFVTAIGVATEVTGTGNDGNAVVYKNGVATTVSVTIEGGTATIVRASANASNGISFSAGDALGVNVTNVAGGPTSFTNTTATVQIQLS